MDEIVQSQRIYFNILSYLLLTGDTYKPFLNLCYGNRIFREQTQKFLYKRVRIRDIQRTHKFCATIASSPRLGSFVHLLHFHRDRGYRALMSHIPGAMDQYAAALKNMPNLEYLYSNETYTFPGWVYGESNASCRRLVEATIYTTFWDTEMAEWLDAQQRIRILSVCVSHMDSPELAVVPLHTQTLAALEVYEGSYGPVQSLIRLTDAPPIKTVSIYNHSTNDTAFLDVLSLLWRFSSTLRTFTVRKLTDDVDVLARSLMLLAKGTPRLGYFGIIPWPILQTDRVRLLAEMAGMHSLRTVEVQMARWDPVPVSSGQKALASEVRTYIKSVGVVIFHIPSQNNSRQVWVLNNRGEFQQSDNW